MEQKNFRLRWVFFALVSIGIGVRLWVGLHFQTHAWIDEIWYVLNPAYKLLTGSPLIQEDAVEYGIRSWLPPAIIYLWLKFLSILGITQGTAVIPGVQTFIQGLTAVSILSFSFALKKAFRLSLPPIAAALALLFTPDLIHYASTADLSVLGAPFLLFGLSFILSNHSKPWIGWTLLCFSSLIRVQYALFPLVLFLTYGKNRRWPQLGSLVLVGICSLGASFALDSWIYGKPILPIWNYFTHNAQGGSAVFGTTPFYFSFELLWRFMTEAGFLFTLLTLGFAAKKAPFLVISASLFFAAHTYVGHKEYRFFYGAALLFTGIWATALQSWIENKPTRLRVSLGVAALCLFIINAGWRAQKKTGWREFELPAALETFAGTRPDLKGLLVVGWNGTQYGGHYTLHKLVRYEFLPSHENAKAARLNHSDFNYIITGGNEPVPCKETIQNRGGAVLYRCVEEEMRLFLR